MTRWRQRIAIFIVPRNAITPRGVPYQRPRLPFSPVSRSPVTDLSSRLRACVTKCKSRVDRVRVRYISSPFRNSFSPTRWQPAANVANEGELSKRCNSNSIDDCSVVFQNYRIRYLHAYLLMLNRVIRAAINKRDNCANRFISAIAPLFNLFSTNVATISVLSVRRAAHSDTQQQC